jgi:hypothetical protein
MATCIGIGLTFISIVAKFYLVELVFQPELSHHQLQLKYQDEKSLLTLFPPDITFTFLPIFLLIAK